MDALLEDMVRHARDVLVQAYGDLWEAEIDWDAPTALHMIAGGVDRVAVSYATGLIAGVAAAFDMTPLTLIDEVRDVTPDVRRELVVATAQLDGKVIDVETSAVRDYRDAGIRMMLGSGAVANNRLRAKPRARARKIK